jgi:hypothetical protein
LAGRQHASAFDLNDPLHMMDGLETETALREFFALKRQSKDAWVELLGGFSGSQPSGRAALPGGASGEIGLFSTKFRELELAA